MAIIKSTGHASWGFELPPTGWQRARIHETVEIKGTKKDASKKMMVIPFCVGESEKPNVTAYCLLDNVQGLRKIVDIVVATGLHESIMREKKIDLTAGVDENVVKNDKFLTYVTAKLAGKTVDLNIQHREYEAEDDQGAKVKRKQADIKDIRPVSDNKSAQSAGKVAPQQEISDSAWD